MYVPSVFTMAASSTPATWLFVPEYATEGVLRLGPESAPSMRGAPYIHGQPYGDAFRWARRSSRLEKCWRSPQSRCGAVSWRGTVAWGGPRYRPTAASPATTITMTRARTL